MASTKLIHCLKQLRKQYKYNQEFVASALNITRQAYSHYETGRSTPPTDVCSKIADFYNLPQETIFSLLIHEDAITTSVNADTATDDNELSKYLNYINEDKNYARFKNLPKTEQDILYYYENISKKDQNEILEILKLKFRNQKL